MKANLEKAYENHKPVVLMVGPDNFELGRVIGLVWALGAAAPGRRRGLVRYLAFLGSGSSDYPIEVLKKAGVDMTEPQPILDTITVFAGLLDSMEELLAAQ